LEAANITAFGTTGTGRPNGGQHCHARLPRQARPCNRLRCLCGYTTLATHTQPQSEIPCRHSPHNPARPFYVWDCLNDAEGQYVLIREEEDEV